MAFNPLIPADAEASGIPVAILRYVLHNKTKRTVHATLCASMSIGADGQSGKPLGNTNTYRDEERLRGLFMSSGGVDKAAEQFGTIALATTSQEGSYRCAWPTEGWSAALLLVDLEARTVQFVQAFCSSDLPEIEFLHATHDAGLMSFRVNLPLGRASRPLLPPTARWAAL